MTSWKVKSHSILWRSPLRKYRLNLNFFSYIRSNSHSSQDLTMKLFESDHIFKYSWEYVTAANWKKYPNDLLLHVISVDTLSRTIDPVKKTLTTERLIGCKQSIPSWLAYIVGTADVSYVRELSVVDLPNKKLVMKSINLTLNHLLLVNETVVYTPYKVEKNDVDAKLAGKVVIDGEVTELSIPEVSSLGANAVDNNTTETLNTSARPLLKDFDFGTLSDFDFDGKSFLHDDLKGDTLTENLATQSVKNEAVKNEIKNNNVITKGDENNNYTLFSQSAEITAYGSFQRVTNKIEQWSIERFMQNANIGKMGFEKVLNKLQETWAETGEFLGKELDDIITMHHAKH